MINRTGSSYLFDRMMSDVRSSYERFVDAQATAADGKRIRGVGDDPFGASQSIRLAASISDTRSFRESAESALGYVGTAEGALMGIESKLERVRDIIIGARGAGITQGDMSRMADELIVMKDSIRDLANSQYDGKYVFSGVDAGTMPYPAGTDAAAAYVGGTTVMTKRVDTSATGMNIGVLGDTVFSTTGGATNSIFDEIDAVVADLQGGGANLATRLTGIDTQLSNVRAGMATLGTITQRLESKVDQLNGLEERLEAAKASIEEVDLAEAVMKMQSESTMYQAALAGSSRMMQMSLLDFL